MQASFTYILYVHIGHTRVKYVSYWRMPVEIRVVTWDEKQDNEVHRHGAPIYACTGQPAFLIKGGGVGSGGVGVG